MRDIGDKIFQRRKELNLTLEDVGKAVGVGKSTVRKWENGMIKNMGSDKIKKLADVLHMKAVELVPVYDGEYHIESKSPSEKSIDDERLEALHQDPRLGLLFDHTRKMKKEDVDFMIRIAERMLKERDDDA